MKKTISLLLAMCMLLSIVPAMGVNVSAGGGTSYQIFSEDFETLSNIERWNFSDSDGLQNGWISSIGWFGDDELPAGGHFLASASYINDNAKEFFDGNYGIQNPDNLVMTPEIEIPAGFNTTLTFDVFAADPEYAEEKYTVYFDTGEMGYILHSERLDSTASFDSPKTVSVDLSNFAGQRGTITFRHHETSDQFMICLDNVRVLASETASETDMVNLEIFVVNGGYENAGIVTGEGTYAAGSEVTVTAIPNMGFGFWGWSAEGDIPICDTLSYTFTINEDTLLIADFFKAPFDDICGTDYYFEPIRWAVDEGITTGTSAATFSPNATCTRAQVVTFLHRSIGCPMPMPESPFIDVTGGEYDCDAVLWAAGSTITTGTSENTFSPNDTCTRAQVVTFLWRLFGCPTPSTGSNPFTDINSSAYYYNAVLWAVENGITDGTSATTFSPDATCTRGQIVTFLWRAAH